MPTHRGGSHRCSIRQMCKLYARERKKITRKLHNSPGILSNRARFAFCNVDICRMNNWNMCGAREREELQSRRRCVCRFFSCRLSKLDFIHKKKIFFVLHSHQALIWSTSADSGKLINELSYSFMNETPREKLPATRAQKINDRVQVNALITSISLGALYHLLIDAESPPAHWRWNASGLSEGRPWWNGSIHE